MNPDPKFQDKRRYKRVSYDGSSFIATPADAADVIEHSDDPGAYTITDVWMTPHEFESLTEFCGF